MKSQEYFQTYLEDGSMDQLVPRAIVHRDGLLHRSVHIFILNKHAELLVTKRSSSKDICPGDWDLSAAEHQRPGESAFESAFRGLREELNITAVTIRPILAWNRHRMTYEAMGLIDYEETMSFLAYYDGDIQFADGEVTESQWVPKTELKDFIRFSKITPWMQRDLRALGWL